MARSLAPDHEELHQTVKRLKDFLDRVTPFLAPIGKAENMDHDFN
ncbi:MAG: hypothetical protein WCG27_03575 [Pseudomonadota bacterium]